MSVAPLEFSNEQSQALASDEGERFYVYDDATGLPLKKGMTLHGNATIGIGRNLMSVGGEGLNGNEVLYLLNDDEIQLIDEIEQLSWWQALGVPGQSYISDRQYVIVCMAFNMGYAGMLSFKSMISALTARNYSLAAEELLNSHVAQELPARYQRYANILRSGSM